MAGAVESSRFERSMSGSKAVRSASTRETKTSRSLSLMRAQGSGIGFGFDGFALGWVVLAAD